LRSLLALKLSLRSSLPPIFLRRYLWSAAGVRSHAPVLLSLRCNFAACDLVLSGGFFHLV
jgi:hypothetical protein